MGVISKLLEVLLLFEVQDVFRGAQTWWQAASLFIQLSNVEQIGVLAMMVIALRAAISVTLQSAMVTWDAMSRAGRAVKNLSAAIVTLFGWGPPKG